MRRALRLLTTTQVVTLSHVVSVVVDYLLPVPLRPIEECHRYPLQRRKTLSHRRGGLATRRAEQRDLHETPRGVLRRPV